MRVLVADDEAISRRLVERTISPLGVEVVMAEDGAAAWARVADPLLDIRLVVADVMMPGMTGFDLVRKIRDTDVGRYVFVILATALDSAEDISRGFEYGADDYVTKPIDRMALFNRVRVGLRIVQLEQQLERLAHVDSLTGVSNRRAFDDALMRQIERSKRFHRPFAIAMVDLDSFKSYNDSYGHAAGDWALQRVAQTIERQLRGTDEVFRYGGEEFVCLLPETGPEGARIVGERLREAVAEEQLPHKGGRSGVVTISVGVACYEGHENEDPAKTLIEADRALYAAKDAGRNRVIVAASTTSGAGSTS